jgi:hypothetical protein
MRRDLDFYQTASWQVDALVDYVPEIKGNICFPCIGDGSLLNALLKQRKDGSYIFHPGNTPIITNDINTDRFATTHGDARLPVTWQNMREHLDPHNGDPDTFDWAIENPPFNIEIDILMEAYKHVRYGVIFMSRLSFVEPVGSQKRKGVMSTPRGPWLKEHPIFKQVVLERYSFTGDGASDSVTTAWNVWLKPGVTISNPGVFSAYGYRP